MYSKIQNFIGTFAKQTQRIKPKMQKCAGFKTYDTKDILSNNEVQIYKRFFDKMDSNKDGFLTKDDLQNGLKDFANHTVSEEELSETMDILDRDRDGSVGFDDFISYIAWSKQMRTEEAIKYAFETFDKNSDGLVNKEELRNALASLGLFPNEASLSSILLLSDHDKDGFVTLDEFKKVFYSKDITKQH